MTEPTTATLDAALERAHADGILVARLGDDSWLAQSSEPELRGPYLLVLEDDGTGGHCECAGGSYREICKHRAAAIAAARGHYPIVEPTAIRGPGDFAPPRRETRSERHAREIREYDAVSAARRAAATVEARDYHELFPE